MTTTADTTGNRTNRRDDSDTGIGGFAVPRAARQPPPHQWFLYTGPETLERIDW
jgi:hypothetical protein